MTAEVDRKETFNGVESDLQSSRAARKPHSLFKRATLTLAACVTAGFIALGGSTAAQADDDWGGSDGGSTGSGAEGRWHTVYPGANTSAYERYSQNVASVYSNSYASGPNYADDFLRNYRGMSEGMIQICRNAEFIWYWGHYPAQNGLTHMDANFNTNNTPLPTEASSSLGRPANEEEWDAWMNTGRHRFGTAWQDGRMDMICASNAWLNREITVTESETREQDRSIQRTGVAYLSADIAPGIDFSGDIGDHALEYQNNTNVTPYGELLQDIADGVHDNTPHSQLLDLIDEARAISDPHNEDNPAAVSTAFTEQNKQALAEGGVLNITESHRYQPVELERSQTQQRSREVTYNCDPGQDHNAGQCEVVNTGSWSSWTDVGGINEGDPRAGQLESFRNHAAFQTIGVRCNMDDFEALANNVDGLTYHRDTGADNVFQGVAHTPVQELNGSAPQWHFGNPDHDNARLAATGDLAFYTLECFTACTPDSREGVEIAGEDDRRSVDESYGDHIDSNGSTTNTDRENTVDFAGGFGLVANNQRHYFDYTVPTVRTGGDIVSATPVQTVIERWEHGGLGVDPNGDGGVFSARAHSENGNEIDLFRGNDEISVRWDGTYTPGSNETITVIDDVENVFSYAADWATPSSNPEVVHVSWNYELEFASTVPSMVRPGGNTGGSNGESYLGGTETVTDTTYSRCFYNAAPGVGQGGATSDVPREFNGVFENAGTSLPVFDGDMFAGDVAEVGFIRNARGN